MSTRVLHVSDLHIGARRALHEPELEGAIAELVERVDPALVLATGDLTHRGRRAEHEAAARFLRSLGPPLLVVPGNHDIPPLPPARFSHTWREFKRVQGLLTEEMEKLAASADAAARAAERQGVDQARLDESLARLRVTLARFAVLQNALDEASETFGRFALVVPRK